MAGRSAKNSLRSASVTSFVGIGLLLSCTALLPVAHAATPVRFSGELGGIVTDVSGKPQPGAVVLLFNKQDRLLLKAATDSIGTFSFAELMPDLYSVQVSLSSFVPAMKEHVQIKAGMRSLLSINLSRVFSSVQLVSTTPLAGGLMSDNWKWILRTDNSLRPILRILPVDPSAPGASKDPAPTSTRGPVFTDSRGMILLSAGDGPQVSSTGAADLGTQFAFATSVYGGNHFAVSGDLGYAPVTGGPQSASFRTTYSRDFAFGASPAVSVTMRQFVMPMRIGQAMAGSPNDNTLPTLRTLGLSFDDKAQVGDDTNLEYGFEMDNVSFLDHLSYFSPYAKLTHSITHGHVDIAWTSGNARPELGMNPANGGLGYTSADGDLQRDLASLSMLPRVSLMNGNTKVQRGEDYEIGVSERFGSREYRVSAYYNDVSNTTLTIASPYPGNLFQGDLLPDMFSNSAVFDAGKFQTVGYDASVTQDLGQTYKISMILGEPGVLAARSETINGTSADELRNLMETKQRLAATLRGSGTIKRSGTRFIASYQWTNYHSAVPGPVFSTQSMQPEPGLNVMIRQPIPSIPGVPGHIEASAELRNLMAQGYLPLSTPGGQQLLLVNTPRSLRGGLAFVF
jgi:hypothetical protein